jgi:hypothetical protein
LVHLARKKGEREEKERRKEKEKRKRCGRSASSTNCTMVFKEATVMLEIYNWADNTRVVNFQRTVAPFNVFLLQYADKLPVQTMLTAGKFEDCGAVGWDICSSVSRLLRTEVLHGPNVSHFVDLA